MKKYHDELRWLYMELYQNSDMFAELCDNMYRFFNERSVRLRKRDTQKEKDPGWFKEMICWE